MIEFEWEKKASRAEAAALLRELADSLAGDGKVELERDGWELKLQVGDEVEVEIELEAQDDETELEIGLKWSRNADGRDAGSSAS